MIKTNKSKMISESEFLISVVGFTRRDKMENSAVKWMKLTESLRQTQKTKSSIASWAIASTCTQNGWILNYKNILWLITNRWGKGALNVQVIDGENNP